MYRDTKSLLESEKKKKPEIAALFEQDLSLEDIEALKIPKWIRQALVKEKKQKMREADIMARMKIVDSVNPEIYGEIRRWGCCDTFIRVDRGGAIEVKADKLIFLPTTGGVWVETAFSAFVDPIVYRTQIITTNSSRTDYTMKYKQELAARFPDAPLLFEPPVTGSAGRQTMGKLAAHGVRFF
jgi:hypothetical protein